MEYMLGIVPLAVAAIGVWLGLKSNIEFKKYQEKLRTYNNYFEIVASSLYITDKKELTEIIRRQMLSLHEIALYAPKDIVEELATIQPLDFSTNNQTQEEADRKKELYFSLFNKMRKDLDCNSEKIEVVSLNKLFFSGK